MRKFLFKALPYAEADPTEIPLSLILSPPITMHLEAENKDAAVIAFKKLYPHSSILTVLTCPAKISEKR